uniref:Diguanylate cyclase/phosphodiesterase with PAS/PAC sensor(S) n=1 Tax=Nitratidesulfovibrio vulgaris (strain DSM 19637 / Miyazaki F) TaxID=883 RepID=B8DPY6_NITV9
MNTGEQHQPATVTSEPPPPPLGPRRSLRGGAAFGLTAILGALGLICVLATGSLVVGRLDAFEHELAAANARRAVNALQSDVRRLDALLKDWAWWDDSYQFMVDVNPAYIESNITPEVFRDQHLDAIVFISVDGQVAHSAAPDIVSGGVEKADPSLLAFMRQAVATLPHTVQHDGLSGLVRIGDATWMTACRPVLDSQQGSPARGWIWMARLVDDPYQKELARNTELQLALVPALAENLPHVLRQLADVAAAAPKRDKPAPETPVVGVDSHTIWSGVLLADLGGGPPLAVTVQAHRALGETARNIVHSGLLVVLTLSILALIAGLLFLDRRVLSRLAALSAQVAANVPAAKLATMPQGGDELDRLALVTSWAFQSIRENEQFLSEMLDALKVGVMLVDRETRTIVSINSHACALLGRDAAEVTGRRCHQFVCPAEEGACPVCDLGLPMDHAKRNLLTATGSLDILKSVVPISREGKEYLLETFIDISDLEHTRRMLEESEEQYRAMFLNTGTPAILINEDTTIALANPEFLRLVRMVQADLDHRPSWTGFFHEHDLPRMLGYHADRRNGVAAPREYETRLIDAAGGLHHVAMTVTMIPHTHQSVAFIRDITDMKLAEARLQELAFTDSLTGLPNRLRGLETLDDMLTEARRKAQPLGVLLLDLDDFKLVNDSMGHATGDVVLMEVGRRLGAVLDPDEAVARLGGDEFIIFTAARGGSEAHAELAKRLITEFSTPFRVAHSEVYLGVSIGIAAFPADGDTGGHLVRCADLAMYRAKASGKNTYRFYTPELTRAAQHRLEVEAELRPAIAQGHIVPYYQPVVDLGSGRIVGAEALARWRKPDGSLVAPAEFIPVAEQTGLVTSIDMAVISRACSQTLAWTEAGLGRLRVSCNISARHLQRGNLPGDIRAILDASGLSAAQLALEVTETVYMENIDKARAMLDAVTELGVPIVLDDFGTGYSSLSYLQSLSFDIIKIDRSFVKDLPDASSLALLRAMLGIAAGLGVTSLAEGVETVEQYVLLKSLGCGKGQGYLFSPPVPAARFEELLREQKAGKRFP